jgi:predicted nuclease of predicted toxin-antitoxin system
VAELSPGISDDDVLAQADALGAPLVTCDKDFGELVYRQGRANRGIVLTRLAGLSNDQKAAIVSAAIAAHAAELVGSFTVVSPGQVRIRKSP